MWLFLRNPPYLFLMPSVSLCARVRVCDWQNRAFTIGRKIRPDALTQKRQKESLTLDFAGQTRRCEERKFT